MPETTAEKKAPAEKKTPAKKKAAAKKGGSRKKRFSLVIVESPAKERTISRFLPNDFVVKASYGHVRDLPARKLGVDEKDGFKPSYVLLPRTEKFLKELKKLAVDAEFVYLATDHDREGESIAWHLSEILGLKPEQIKRITFHEITKGAIQDALKHPRDIDQSLVFAQQSRRVIDRLVGYKLSPVLWEKVRKGLSAGRVQSVASRILVERHKEIKDFESEDYWTLEAGLEKKGAKPTFVSKLTSWKGEKIESTQTYELFCENYRVRTTGFKTEGSIQEVVDALKGLPFKVTTVDPKETKRRPAAPFATSTLQQESSRKLGYPPEYTMRIAQGLYEGVPIGGQDRIGLITYMRTDSYNVAKTAQDEAAKFIDESYGKDYLPEKPNVYATKTKRAQEAHEAIRPTSVLRRPEDIKQFLTPEQAKLYELIWRRFVASQMTGAVYDTVSVDVTAGEAVFHSTGRTLKFDGFLKVYREEKSEEELEEEDAVSMPALEVGDELKVLELKPEAHKTSPPPHYNEASLIKTLEKHGIGRPSTYAPTIKTLLDRGYAQKGQRDKKLMPTDLGILVNEKLTGFFEDVVTLSYTADVEEKLDGIAEGGQTWNQVVQEFYDPFIKNVERAKKEMPSSKVQPKEVDEKCPKCKAPMLLRESRFGKYLSCSTFPKCRGKIPLDSEGKKAAPEKTDEKCDKCGKVMVIRTGRRGKFLACSGYPECKNTYSIGEDGKKIVTSRPVETDRPCPKCNKNPLWLRQGKRGPFLACSGYPKCRNILPVSKEEAEKIREKHDPASAKTSG